MKVLKLGYLRNKKCPKCNSILQYDLKSNDIEVDMRKVFQDIDTQMNYYYCYITCPICNKKIDISKDVCNFKKDKEKYEI